MSMENVDINTAKQVIEQANKETIEACGKAVNEVLEKFGCSLEAIMIVTPRGNIPQVSIIIKQ